MNSGQTRIVEVVEQVVEDEVIVYNLETYDVHLLNATTTAVWRHCDGGSTVNELVVLAAGDLGKPIDADLVLAALAELDRAGCWSATSKRRADCRVVS